MFEIVIAREQQHFHLDEAAVAAMIQSPGRFSFRCAVCRELFDPRQLFNLDRSVTGGKCELVCAECGPRFANLRDARLFRLLDTLRHALEAYQKRQAELERRRVAEIERRVRQTGIQLVNVQSPKRDPIRARRQSTAGWDMLQQSA